MAQMQCTSVQSMYSILVISLPEVFKISLNWSFCIPSCCYNRRSICQLNGLPRDPKHRRLDYLTEDGKTSRALCALNFLILTSWANVKKDTAKTLHSTNRSVQYPRIAFPQDSQNDCKRGNKLNDVIDNIYEPSVVKFVVNKTDLNVNK